MDIKFRNFTNTKQVLRACNFLESYLTDCYPLPNEGDRVGHLIGNESGVPIFNVYKTKTALVFEYIED